MTKTCKGFLGFSFLLVLSSVPTAAQTVLCSKAMNAESCDRLAKPLEPQLKQLGAPTEWTYVILDGNDWRRATQRFKTEKNTTAAFTVLELRTTFFNADYIQQRLPRPPLDVLAHEVGHIACNCRSEMRAKFVAEQLLAGMKANR